MRPTSTANQSIPSTVVAVLARKVYLQRSNSDTTSPGATGQFDSSWGGSGTLGNSDACPPEIKTSYECDNPQESESPRRVTSAPRKRFPGHIKSFSHELNLKGVCPFPFWKPRRLNNLKEFLATIRAKFDRAKEEVDSDLHIFAADMLGILEKNAETHPEWQDTIEDLLVLARSCAMTSPQEFWHQCEGIVKELDDRREELPMGMLKRLHTRMLFILTQCTRLRQFHEENWLAEDEHVFHFHRSLKPADTPGPERDGKMALDSKASKVTSAEKSYSQEQSKWESDHVVVPGNFRPSLAEDTKNLDSAAGQNRMASWKKFPSPSRKSPKEAASVKVEHNENIVETSKILDNRSGISDAELAKAKVPALPPPNDLHVPSLMPKHKHKFSWGYLGDQPIVSDEGFVECRVCAEKVPALHVQDHFRIRAIADQCDLEGLRVNERLTRIAETLEKLMESFSAKDMQHAVRSPNGAKVSNSSVTEKSELLSQKYSDWSHRGPEDMLDCFVEADTSAMDDMKALPSMSCKTQFGPKSDQGTRTSSAGSMTPRLPIMTLQTSTIDLLLSWNGSFSEHGDLPQMNELADIARCVANTPLDDDRSLPYLLCCLEDLKVVIDRRKFDSLTVETFGALIEKLIREKYSRLCELVDDGDVDITSTVIDVDDVLRSLWSSPIHSSKDHTSIDDFEIIKPREEYEVPALHLHDHSRICPVADRCDLKGLRVNKRLVRIAETLEILMALKHGTRARP